MFHNMSGITPLQRKDIRELVGCCWRLCGITQGFPTWGSQGVHRTFTIWGYTTVKIIFVYSKLNYTKDTILFVTCGGCDIVFPDSLSAMCSYLYVCVRMRLCVFVSIRAELCHADTESRGEILACRNRNNIPSWKKKNTQSFLDCWIKEQGIDLIYERGNLRLLLLWSVAISKIKFKFKCFNLKIPLKITL